MLFETLRLCARPLHQSDHPGFFDLMSNPEVMGLIPQQPFSKEQSTKKLSELIYLEKSSDTRIWCLCTKNSDELIGICGLLKNNDNEDEIAYRIREKYWGLGYGTEIAKGLIDYCFNSTDSELVTADVNVENKRSIKILDKFFNVSKEFFNDEDMCRDRRYVLTRNDWKLRFE